MTKYRIEEPFDVSFTVRIKGTMRGDGLVYTMTGHVAHDLVEEFVKRKIRENIGIEHVELSIEINNLEEKLKTDFSKQKERKKMAKKRCKSLNCNRLIHEKGYCIKHYESEQQEEKWLLDT